MDNTWRSAMEGRQKTGDKEDRLRNGWYESHKMAFYCAKVRIDSARGIIEENEKCLRADSHALRKTGLLTPLCHDTSECLSVVSAYVSIDVGFSDVIGVHLQLEDNLWDPLRMSAQMCR